jgi:hypothetical protein
MEKNFDTKNSLNYFRNLIPVFALGGVAIGLFAWYKSGQMSSAFIFALFGLGAGLLMYTYMWQRYGKITYKINSEEIVKKRGESVVESVIICEAEYYYIKKPETYLRVKLRSGNDFEFPMTLGLDDDIVKTLESVGVRAKS